MMNLLRRGCRRFGPMFLVMVVAGALLSGPSVAQGLVTELPFASSVAPPGAGPVGVAASPGKLLVTIGCSQVVSIDPTTGTVSSFVMLPTPPAGCIEAYIAIAPGKATSAAFLDTKVMLTSTGVFTQPKNEAGFESNFVYVTQGSTVLKIAPNGSSVSTFHTFSSGQCGNTHTGITFDRVGTFGNKLIITCSSFSSSSSGTGNIWLLNNDGTTTTSPSAFAVIAAAGASFFEGPDVAPSTTTLPSGFGGQLLVASENASNPVGPPGQVFAVSPSGMVSTVASIPFAEAVGLIPSTQCNFGSSGGTYFTAVFGNNEVRKLPQIAFTGPPSLAGSALVPSEFGSAGSPGLTLLKLPGATPGATSVTTSTFSAFLATHEGAAFCVNSVPTDLGTPPTGNIQRDPDDFFINPNASGVITAVFSPIPGVFDPFTMIADVQHMRAGFTGTEKSFAFCVAEPVPTPTGPGRTCKFFKNMLGIPPEALVDGIYTGLLYFKAEFTGPGPDPDAGGGG